MSRGMLVMGALLAACRAGLPPEPPGGDAADASAAVPAWTPAADPTQTSAFEGVRLDGGGHAHHHGDAPAPAAEPEHGPTPAAHDHAAKESK